MGFRFRKSIKAGPVRFNLSNSGVGYSVGAGGFRYTSSPKKKKKSSVWLVLFKWMFYFAIASAVLALIVNYWYVWLILALLAGSLWGLVKLHNHISNPAPAPQPAEIQSSQEKVETEKLPADEPAPKEESKVFTYQVAGVQHYMDSLMSMMEPNYLYDYKKQELIDTYNTDRSIYRQTVDNKVLKLAPEPTNPHDPNAIQVKLGGLLVGYIAAKDCKHLLEKMGNDEIVNVHAEVFGGKYKRVNEDYDWERNRTKYTMEWGEDPYGIRLFIREKI